MKILYFSLMRERLGKDNEELQFSGKVYELRNMLIERYPELQSVISVCRFAVNHEYVGDNFELQGNEEVALIPPVSGG